MSIRAVARLETRRLVASPGLWLATVAFAVVVAIGTAIPSLAMSSPDPATGAAFLLAPGVELLLPGLAILVTYAAIAEHRSRGTVHVWFTVPIDRRGVLIAITIARLLVLSTVVLAGLGAGIAACSFIYGIPPLQPVIGFAGMTLFTSASFALIGLGSSAATAHPRRALATLLGGWLVAHALWPPFVTNVLAPSLVDDPAIVDAILRLSPTEAYRAAASGILPATPYLELGVEGQAHTTAEGQVVGGELLATELLFVLLVLSAWALLAMYVGARRFGRADID